MATNDAIGLDCAWCGGEIERPFGNQRDEWFCSAYHRTASNRALKRLQDRGYSYARYLGRLTRHQTERIGGRLTRREAFFSEKEPGEYDDDMEDGR